MAVAACDQILYPHAVDAMPLRVRRKTGRIGLASKSFLIRREQPELKNGYTHITVNYLTGDF